MVRGSPSQGHPLGSASRGCLPAGALYACSTHGLIYQSDGSSAWSTWATLGTVADILDLPTAEMDNSLVFAPDGAGGVQARAESGGGGGGGPECGDGWLQQDALDPTYGDDFDEASLNGRWSRHVVTSGEEAYQQAGGSFLRVTWDTGAAARSYCQTPAVMPTNCEVVLGPLIWKGYGTDMLGPMIVDDSGNGKATGGWDGRLKLITLGGWGYSSLGAGIDDAAPWSFVQNFRYWLRLRKAGTSYYSSISFNGIEWGSETGSETFTGATKIGWGKFNTTQANAVLVGRFNVINVS